MKIRWAFVLTLQLLAGCASGPGYDSMHAREPAIAATEGRLYFYRPWGLEGWVLQPAIRVDDRKVGDAVPGGYLYVDEPAGTYKVSATTEAEESVLVPLAAGESGFIRFDPLMGAVVGHISPTVVHPGRASAEIRTCRYTGAD